MEIHYVLVNCELNAEREIIEQIVKVPQVKEVRGTLGVFDIFVKIQAESTDELRDVVTNKLRKIPKVQSTNTLTALVRQGGF